MEEETPESLLKKRQKILHDDCLARMRRMRENRFGAVVTDPPYGLKFMGKTWDHGVPGKEFWEEALRVTKPGGYLVAFGGTRTFHRLACAIEDAGWVLRDTLCWVHSQGFPKSLNISKAIDKEAGAVRKGASPSSEEAVAWEGFGTALKPSFEPIVLAQKPLDGTYAKNVMKWGVGGLNIDACRVRVGPPGKIRTGEESQNRRYVTRGSVNFAATPGPRGGDPSGRWPANLIHDGSEEVVKRFPFGKSGKPGVRRKPHETTSMSGRLALTGGSEVGYADDGSAARFFYCAKANKREKGEGNSHPTVKPIALMQYLLRLVVPEGQEILDPFAGSGTTIVAAARQDVLAVGIEKELQYVRIARRRVKKERKI